MALGIMEQLVHSTVRIETILHDGRVSRGTGFYMNFLQTEENTFPVLITNKHVVANAKVGLLHVTSANSEGLPNIGKHQRYEIDNFEDRCIKHPDPKVDLVALPMGPLFNKLRLEGEEAFYIPLRTNLIPSDMVRAELSYMEDIVMIGYPNGIWDATNNLPVIRKGITATHPNISLNAKQEFLTDIASFPGSSGSPVFLANIGGYTDNKGNTYMGSDRIYLLGIHYAGAMHTTTGELKIITAPHNEMAIPVTQIPNNIGIAINSKEIFELEREVGREAGIKV